MLLSPYHAGGQRPPAQVLRNSLPGHSRLAAISASWLVSSKVAPPVARVPIERFAGAHPSHFVGPFRSQGHGRPCLSIGTRATGSLLHGYLMQTKWCKKWHFFTPFISFYSVGVKNGTFLHQILDSANAPPCYNPCYASVHEAEFRTRLAEHLSG